MTSQQRLLRYTLTTLISLTLPLTLTGTALATTPPDPIPNCGGCGGGGGGGGGGDIGRLRISGTCGDQLDLRVQKSGDPIKVAITIPSPDPSEQWNLNATEQNYDAVTGGRVGNPTDMIATNAMPPPVYTAIEGGFSTTGFMPNTAGVTHGFNYTATRASDGLTCTNTGYWTTPSGTQGPTAQNPSGKPDTPPALTGATEADNATNDAALQFDQEMLTTDQGIPDLSRFAVTVDGDARTVTAITITNDAPPANAVLTLTLDGAALTTGQTVTVTYHQPLTAATPALQDMDGLTTPSFGPISIPVF